VNNYTRNECSFSPPEIRPGHGVVFLQIIVQNGPAYGQIPVVEGIGPAPALGAKALTANNQRVEKTEREQTRLNYTRNEWERCKTTLQTSGEDVKINTRNEWGRCENTLVTSGEDVEIHSKRVGKM
jgi:hypothetical protein